MPKAATKVKAKTAWEVKEKETITLLQNLCGYPLSMAKAEMYEPYELAREGYYADAVFIAAPGCFYRGVAIEIQGMGKHSNIAGMNIDHRKCAFAQMSGWLWFQTTHSNAKAMAPLLKEMINTVILSDMG